MTSFQRTGRRERLFFRSEGGPYKDGVPVPIGSRDAALALLRDLGRDPWGRAALRRLYAETVGRASICWETDRAVLEGLSRPLVTREIKVWSVPIPAMEMPGGALLPAPETTAKPAKEKPPKPRPLLESPRWSAPRVPLGAEIDAIFSYSGVTSPMEATVTISESNRGSASEEVAKLQTTVPAGAGDHKVKWKRTAEEAEADLEHDQEEGDTGPLEYRFKVETKEVVCPGESGPLWLTNTVMVKMAEEADQAKHDRPQIVVLEDALGEESRATLKDGEAKFEKVLVGPVTIRLAAPRFTDLAWSSPKVPVGEEVEAVFKYEDATAGMKVDVAIYEWNADGSSTELKRVEVELKGPSGEARVPFTRAEEEAQDDMAADEREGDTGPLQYLYFVETKDGMASAAPAPLLLTHTVTLKLEHETSEEALPEGAEIILLGADGTEHRARLSSGEAKFEGVVCGPMKVMHAPPPELDDAP